MTMHRTPRPRTAHLWLGLVLSLVALSTLPLVALSTLGHAA